MTALVLDQQPELAWGSLMIATDAPADVPWVCEALATDTDFGNPVPLVEEVRSWLLGGASLSTVTGWGERTVPIRIRLSAEDGQAMSQAEAAFFTEARRSERGLRPAPLVWTPPMLAAWPAVYDVTRATFERDYPDGWGHSERFRHCRYFRLTFTTLPWVRDPETVTIPALPVPVNPEAPANRVVIDNCESTTGWTPVAIPTAYWASLSLNQIAGYLRVQAIATAGARAPLDLAIDRAGAISMTGTPYLTVDVDVSTFVDGNIVPGSTDGVSVVINNTAYYKVAEIVPAGAASVNVRRLYFEVPEAFTSLRVRNHVYRAPSAVTHQLRVHEIARVDRIEIEGTNGLQVARTAIIGGAAPTGAAIRLDAGPDPLIGSTALIYTGASPVVSLRSLKTASAAVTVDNTKISGAYNDLSVPMVFRVPVNRLARARYSQLARLSFTGNVIVKWQARLVASDGTDIPGSDVVRSGETLLRNPSIDPWRIHCLADVKMPVIDVEGDNTHAVEITISMTTGGANVLIDEGWLANTEQGAVTTVHEPSAFQLSAIELRSPQLDAPVPSVVGTWIGYGTQNITRLARMGMHELEPGPVNIFTATDLARYVPCELEYYQRYPFHPGPGIEDVSGAAE